MAKKEIKVALIGYGGAFNMGLHHANSMHATGGMRVVAVCDANAERLPVAKQDLGEDVETFTDVDQLIKWGGFDLGVVILPHCLHAPIAIKLSKAGKHVITEKPMCVSVKEATAMIDAANASGTMLSVFHNRRWDGDFLALREIVETGLIGNVFHIEMFSGGWTKPRGWWRDDKEVCGGLFYDWGAHFMYWLLQLMPGKMVDVMGYYQKLVWHEISNEDQVQAIIRFDNGAIADFQQSSISRVPRPKWRVLGDKGGVLAGPDHWLVNTEINGIACSEMKIPFKQGEQSKYYQNIADHLLKGEELIVTAHDARRVIAIMESAEKSAKSGKPAKVPFE
jgi:scyllo-inositol 2-dehydrogenase (NADP+)